MTDLAATSGRVRDINSEAERMVKMGHSQARDIQSRQHQLNERWVGSAWVMNGNITVFSNSLLVSFSHSCFLLVFRWESIQQLKRSKEQSLAQAQRYVI